ncbi:hypothetical protein [Flavobacterium sp. HSC-61S13]|uniref:hypothetical protein n=1 Tax=Flavobacterium sp. HSC-61S13 TaxID=2910963 RepID=UPI0020A16395|nr:hypothetical protein [Flavobacterium sp. HSC-61S13]MCP1996814.1 hypothetical protein [Flavobacterium sp. HSC-61S13]
MADTFLVSTGAFTSSTTAWTSIDFSSTATTGSTTSGLFSELDVVVGAVTGESTEIPLAPFKKCGGIM